jgi:cytidine deaminase
MNKIKIETTFSVFHKISDLPEKAQYLMQEAIAIRKTAYAPYSNFQVGAAILLENKSIVLGSNQENAAYPSGLCAERVAIFQAGTLYPNIPIEIIAITATSKTNPVTQPIPPCGACRQTIAEYEISQEKPIAIYFMGESGEIYKSDSLKNLLPLLFERKYL